MTFPSPQYSLSRSNRPGWCVLLVAFALTLAVYWSGLSGSFLFDDYPNIVENQGVQPSDATVSSLVRAALSSPSSEFKRPLASLSFAANYLVTGLDPFWMKLTNLFIHLLNGLLVFLLARALLLLVESRTEPRSVGAASAAMPLNGESTGNASKTKSLTGEEAAEKAAGDIASRASVVAALLAASWMLLPINLTGVLYVVQRMESLANVLVMLGLIGYVAGRRQMLGAVASPAQLARSATPQSCSTGRGFVLCVVSVIACTAIGALAKETAVMLPLYALLVEWLVFGFRNPAGGRNKGLIGLFTLVLLLPMVVGLAWLLPQVLNPGYWSTRDFNLRTRLLSEARIVVDYIRWTVLPTPDALSFYHDDFRISQGLLKPWTTFASIVFLAGLLALTFWLRKRQPLAALGMALFLGCQLLTGTILPLELIYEHRNYFASFGLMLALIPLLVVPSERFLALPRHVLLAGLLLCWTTLTAMTSYAWGNQLRLAEDLAGRAATSPRAQYELGRTYIIFSHYDPASPFTKLAYAPLERSAALPESSILPEQALIFMNARMHVPIKDSWWDSLIAKLSARRAGVQDESSLGALTACVREKRCDLPKQRMVGAFLAALSHPSPSARLLAMYGDYAWNVLEDHALGLSMTQEAVKANGNEPAYLITLARMYAAAGEKNDELVTIKRLEGLNVGGRLNADLAKLRNLVSTP